MSHNSAIEKVMMPILDRLAVELENYKITGKYQRPWRIEMPYNVVTNKPYGGVNIIRLMFECRSKSGWATLKQYNAAGYSLRKGSSGAAIYSPGTSSTKLEDDGTTKVIPRPPRAYYVFNVEDVYHTETGEAHPACDDTFNKGKPIEYCEMYFKNIPITVQLADMAYYHSKQDYIGMPPFEEFNNEISYYSVLAHETIHWTGNVSRLKRLGETKRTLEERAIEELIAEFGATLVCARLNIVDDIVRSETLDYLASWADIIHREPEKVKASIRQALDAFTYLELYQPTPEKS